MPLFRRYIHRCPRIYQNWEKSGVLQDNSYMYFRCLYWWKLYEYDLRCKESTMILMSYYYHYYIHHYYHIIIIIISISFMYFFIIILIIIIIIYGHFYDMLCVLYYDNECIVCIRSGKSFYIHWYGGGPSMAMVFHLRRVSDLFYD